MASNYNLVGLPPVIVVREGTARPPGPPRRPATRWSGISAFKEALYGAQALGSRTDDCGGNARPANRTAVFGRAHWPGVHLGSLPRPHSGPSPAVDRPVLGRSARHAGTARDRARQGRSGP